MGPAGTNQNPNSGASQSPGQAGNQSMNQSANADDVGEILALFGDDNTMHTNQVKNEPTQCGVCKQQIYPFQELEELVRCFICKTWFKRNCVGISESAYKQLVLEQNYCAWSCQTCITNKVANSCVPKVPNDNN